MTETYPVTAAGPRATLRQLRGWHRRLSTIHRRAVDISDEAESVLGECPEAIIISDPIIELHAALSQIEGIIADHLALRSPEKPHDD